MKSPLLRLGAFLFALFHIYCNVFASISELWLSAVHFGGFGAICLLMTNENELVQKDRLRYWFNVLLAVLTVATSAYLILFETALYEREAEYIFSDFLFSLLAIGLAIELT
ncbi:MAG: TRAP transporter permease, partial [Pseudohongiellaceae bacterium]